jgi:hypothetical protein
MKKREDELRRTKRPVISWIPERMMKRFWVIGFAAHIGRQSFLASIASSWFGLRKLHLPMVHHLCMENLKTDVCRAVDEHRIRSIGAGIDALFDRCEDTARHTDHSIRCWLRSNLADRPYKAPFQLTIRLSTRSWYRTLWRRLVYFWFRLYRLQHHLQCLRLRAREGR